MKMAIESEPLFSLAAGCETSFTANGILIYQISREKIHHLNSTAAIVYRLCGEHLPATQIADSLKKTFALLEPPRKEVHQCIEQFLAEGLIVPC
jgi:coenzyme PQQ synthesis protein D (PqqD)